MPSRRHSDAMLRVLLGWLIWDRRFYHPLFLALDRLPVALRARWKE